MDIIRKFPDADAHICLSKPSSDYSLLPSRTGIEHIRSDRIYFPQYFIEFFLNICIFLKKLNLSCKKSIPVGLPRHPAVNKFLMDFAVARCGQVRTFQALTRQKTRKFIAAGLVGSIPVRLGKSE